MTHYTNALPNLSEEEVALLLRPAAEQVTASRLETKSFQHIEPYSIFSEIMLQRARFQRSKIAELYVKNLSEAQIAGTFFAAFFPEPDRARLGIMELLINAIERGNLEITADEKLALVTNNTWAEEIEQRLELEKYADRRVHIQCYRHDLCQEIIITDEGKGFDWAYYMDIDENALTSPTGRGIACAHKISFDEMRYIGSGNSVKARQYFV